MVFFVGILTMNCWNSRYLSHFIDPRIFEPYRLYFDIASNALSVIWLVWNSTVRLMTSPSGLFCLTRCQERMVISIHLKSTRKNIRCLRAVPIIFALQRLSSARAYLPFATFTLSAESWTQSCKWLVCSGCRGYFWLLSLYIFVLMYNLLYSYII